MNVADPMLRARRVTGAFVWLGVTETFAYPLVILLNNIIGPAILPVIYLFVARLVDSTAAVGFDYYTFVIIGFFVNSALAGGLSSFSTALDSAIQQGRFETFLVQPISWYSLPFALAAWPITLSVINGTITGVFGLALGAQIRWTNLPEALLVLALGVAASHAIGTLAASVRLLSKKADPVVAVYNLFASILSGALFPIAMLPWWLRPLSYLLPHTYVISAVRRLLMVEGDVLTGPSLAVSLLVLLLGTIVLYGASLAAFKRTLDFGRRYGVLGGY